MNNGVAEHHNAEPSGITESTPLLGNASGEIGDESPNDEDINSTVMFWQEMRTVAQYAVPILLSQLLEFSLVIIEVVSVGHLSTASLAAVSLGSMTASVTGFAILIGLTTALDTLLPPAFTSPHPHLFSLWAQRMCVVVAVALVPMIGLWLNAERILLGLKQDPEIARLASVYLRWLSLGLPAFAFNSVARRYFQSQGLLLMQTKINCIVAPVNVLLNYLLVWGPAPIRLGFIGAPIASAMSFSLVSILSILYGLRFVPNTVWHPISTKMFTNLGPVVRLGLSGVGQTASEWWAFELVALAASYLGPLSLATQSVILTSSSTTYQTAFSISMAAAIRIGNLLGEKNAKRAGTAASASIAIGLISSLTISTMFMVLRHRWAYIFTNDPDVIRLVASVLPIIALYQIVDTNAAVTAGILRARGQQFIGALLNISAHYIIGLPLGVWFAFRWHMGLHGLWVGLSIALTYCAIIGTWLYHKTDWRVEVTKVTERVAEEDRLQKVTDEEN